MGWLRRYMSYVVPIKVEEYTTEYNPYLEVQYNNGIKLLNTLNANYSFGGLHKVFQKAFKAFPYEHDDASNVLILGFGAGSVKQILRKDIGYNNRIVGVELDPTVIDIAHQHFALPEESEFLELHVKSAQQYLNESHEDFDLIVVDIFNDLIVPDFCRNNNFLSDLGLHLRSEGAIQFNTTFSHFEVLEFEKVLYQRGWDFKRLDLEFFGVQNHVYRIHAD